MCLHLGEIQRAFSCQEACRSRGGKGRGKDSPGLHCIRSAIDRFDFQMSCNNMHPSQNDTGNVSGSGCVAAGKERRFQVMIVSAGTCAPCEGPPTLPSSNAARHTGVHYGLTSS